MLRILSIAVLLVAANANQYYYAPLGPWGLESTIVKLGSKDQKDIKEVRNTSRKTSGTTRDKQVVENVKNEVDDEFEKAEEAFFHAVEKVEHAVEDAIDEEVEVLFPHHKKKATEEE